MANVARALALAALAALLASASSAATAAPTPTLTATAARQCVYDATLGTICTGGPDPRPYNLYKLRVPLASKST